MSGVWHGLAPEHDSSPLGLPRGSANQFRATALPRVLSDPRARGPKPGPAADPSPARDPSQSWHALCHPAVRVGIPKFGTYCLQNPRSLSECALSQGWEGKSQYGPTGIEPLES